MSYQPLCPTIYRKLLEEQQKGNSFLQPTSSSYDIIFDPVEYMEARGYYPPYTSADLFQSTISPYIEHGGFLDIGLDQKTNEKLSLIPLESNETKIIFDTLVWSSSAASSWRGTVDDMQSNSVLELNGKHYPVISAVMPLVTFLHTFLHVLSHQHADLAEKLKEQVALWEDYKCNTVIFDFAVNK